METSHHPSAETQAARKVQGYRRALLARMPNAHIVLAGLPPVDDYELVKCINAGLPSQGLEHVKSVLGVAWSRLAPVLGVSASTLRRYRASRTLPPDESDRVLILARVIGRTLRAREFDLKAARQWLFESNQALHYHAPIDMAGYSVGAWAIYELLGHRVS